MRGGRRGAAAAGMVLGALVAGCAIDRPKPAPPDPTVPRVSAAELGDRERDDTLLDVLTPEERGALARVDGEDDRAIDSAGDASAAPDAPEPAAPHGFFARLGDGIGKVGVAIIGVGVTIGMAVAPFLLF